MKSRWVRKFVPDFWKIYWDWTTTGNFQYRYTPKWRELIMQEVQCMCWVKRYTQRQHLRSWLSTNCGCRKTERITAIAKRNTKHWMEGSLVYKKFMSAKARCNDKNNDSYKRYGLRWIKMEWKDFSEFWKDMRESYYDHVNKYWEKETTIERINVNWNYSKENCTWATWEEQTNNKVNTKKYKYKWDELTISQFAKKYWFTRRFLYERIYKWGWSIKDSIEKERRKQVIY